MKPLPKPACLIITYMHLSSVLQPYQGSGPSNWPPSFQDRDSTEDTSYEKRGRQGGRALQEEEEEEEGVDDLELENGDFDEDSTSIERNGKDWAGREAFDSGFEDLWRKLDKWAPGSREEASHSTLAMVRTTRNLQHSSLPYAFP